MCVFYLLLSHAACFTAYNVCLSYLLLFHASRGRAVMSAVSLSLSHLTAVSGVGLSPALATYETSQVLLAGVPGGFSRGSPVFAHLLIGLSHMG